jgi:hypothetical protein
MKVKIFFNYVPIQLKARQDRDCEFKIRRVNLRFGIAPVLL